MPALAVTPATNLRATFCRLSSRQVRAVKTVRASAEKVDVRVSLHSLCIDKYKGIKAASQVNSLYPKVGIMALPDRLAFQPYLLPDCKHISQSIHST
jgi:hypothetical protein